MNEKDLRVSIRSSRQKSMKRTNGRVQIIREKLRELALNLGPGRQLPTIRELCALLNTSIGTLSDALDLLETEQILFRKERHGVFVSPNIGTASLAIVINASLLSNVTMSPVWGLLCMKMTQEAESRRTFKHEQFTFLLPMPNDPEKHMLPDETIAFLNSRRFNGCLIIGFNLLKEDKTTDLTIPHVCFAGDGYGMIQIDELEMVHNAALTLIQQKCTSIGLWIPTSASLHVGYIPYAKIMREALSANKIPIYEHFLRHVTPPPFRQNQPLTHQEQGYFLAKEVFGPSSGSKPDGVYISDDMMTDGALVALEELGIRVGTDIKIATHANTGSPILFGRSSKMIRLEVDPADIIYAMFTLLDASMVGEVKPLQVVHVKTHLRLPGTGEKK